MHELTLPRDELPPSPKSHVSRYRYLVLVAIIVVLAILVFTFLGLWLAALKNRKSAALVTPQSLETASHIMDNLDTNINPCHNFYQFACNKWIERNPIPDGQVNKYVIQDLMHANKLILREIMDDPKEIDNTRGFQLAKTFYQSCMSEDLIDKRNFTPLHSHLNKLYNGWNSLSPTNQNDLKAFELAKYLEPMLRYFGKSFLFDIGVEQKAGDPSKFLIQFDTGSLILPYPMYLSKEFAEVPKAYSAFINNYGALLGFPKTKLEQLNAIYLFEKELATVNDGEEATDEIINLDALRTHCPVLDWRKLLQSITARSIYTIADGEEIMVSGFDKFKKRCQVIQRYLNEPEGKVTVQDAALWSFVWNTYPLMPNSVQAKTSGFIHVISGINKDSDRWDTCTNELQSKFGMITGRKFVERTFSPRDKQYVTNMTDTLMRTFKQIVMENDWMDSDDKNEAIRKVEMNVGTYFENAMAAAEASQINMFANIIRKDRYAWQSSADTVITSYQPIKNEIIISAGILQKPTYSIAYPLSLNMGSIGQTFGREITRGFDDVGSSYDPEGSYRDWWSGKTREAFEKRTKCMVDQYSNYSISGVNLNGEQTLEENIADAGGLKTAYRALQLMLQDSTHEFKLSGLNLTSEQLFFIGFSQLYCSNLSKEATLLTVMLDSNTIPEYRVNGALSNTPEFSKAFNCSVGSPMNPAKKCSVW